MDSETIISSLILGQFDNLKSCIDKLEGIDKPIGPNKWTPLIYACHYTHPKICEFLIEEKKANVNYLAPHSGVTPVLATCMSTGNTHDLADLEILEMLLKGAENIEAKETKTGMTPLMHAALQGKTLVCNKLLSLGADVNLRDAERWTALCHASSRNNVTTIRVLLSQGADSGAKTKTGETAISIAYSNGNDQTFEILGGMKALNTSLQALHVATSSQQGPETNASLYAGAGGVRSRINDVIKSLTGIETATSQSSSFSPSGTNRAKDTLSLISSNPAYLTLLTPNVPISTCLGMLSKSNTDAQTYLVAFINYLRVNPDISMLDILTKSNLISNIDSTLASLQQVEELCIVAKEKILSFSSNMISANQVNSLQNASFSESGSQADATHEYNILNSGNAREGNQQGSYFNTSNSHHHHHHHPNLSYYFNSTNNNSGNVGSASGQSSHQSPNRQPHFYQMAAVNQQQAAFQQQHHQSSPASQHHHSPAYGAGYHHHHQHHHQNGATLARY